MFSPSMRGFSPGTSHSPNTHDSVIGVSILALGMCVSVSGCLSCLSLWQQHISKTLGRGTQIAGKVRGTKKKQLE